MAKDKYPRLTTGGFLCSCGGPLITEQTDTGNGENVHDIYRVRGTPPRQKA